MDDLKHRDIWAEDAVPLLLEQYKDAKKFEAVLKSICDYMTQIDDAAFKVSGIFGIDSENVDLDAIGKIFNIPRVPGESDVEYRARIKATLVGHNAGTAANVISTARTITGDKAPQFIDEATATFFIYTPDGSQMKRSQVQKTAPAGVLGLPGAAIETGNGALIHLAGRPEVRIICAAQDVTPPPPGDNLLTEDGEQLLTEDGEQIVLEESA